MTNGTQDAAGWLARSEVYAAAVRDYHVARGVDPNSASIMSTVQTNGELVPRRGDKVLDLLASLADVETIANRRVLEVGSGFGALASYLTWKGQPTKLVGIDVRQDFVRTAQSCASRMGLDERLTFEIGNMADLHELSDGCFDVIIANNSFIYLARKQDMEDAITGFHRVLSPGGAVLFFHANKWRIREPFTKAPLIHLLPAPAARMLARMTGWQHNHGRVRLISPPALRRMVRRAGFEDVRIVTFDRPQAQGIRRYFGGFYALAAQTPS